MTTLLSTISAAETCKPYYVIRQTWPSEKMSPKLSCLFERCEGKVKVGCKRLEQKRYQQYQTSILGTFFISFHRHFKLQCFDCRNCSRTTLHVFMFCISIRPVCKQQFEYTGMLSFPISITL